MEFLKTMTITDFLEGRNADAQAIRRYIQRHPDDFKGHINMKGREKDLDETAVAILEKKYPLQVMIINGVSHEEYEQVLKKLTEVQNQLMNTQKALQEKEKDFLLLEIQEQTAQHQLAESDAKTIELETELAKYKRTIFGLYKKT